MINIKTNFILFITLLGTLTVQGTGSWYNYQQQTTAITSITGVYDIFLIGIGGDCIANLDWLKFETGVTPVPTESQGNKDKLYVDSMKIVCTQ